MKGLLVGCVLACGMPTCAGADNFNKTASPGMEKPMHNYFSWDPKTCISKSGVVKLLIKPQHGELTISLVDRIIEKSRFTDSMSVCAGKPIKSFQINYKSEPDFQGVDSFTVQATYGFKNRVVTDVFAITVR